VKYQITHTTLYQYSQQVGLCQNEAKLRPRNFWRQQCNKHRMDIQPPPSDFHERMDYFGNHITYFAVQQPHTQLTVTAISEVSLFPNPTELNACGQPTWEQARNLLQETPTYSQSQNPSSQVAEQNQVFYYAKQCLLDSPMVNISPELANYAQPSFQPNRLLVDVVYDLMNRIYQDFSYDPTFTDIATPLSDVLSHRRGVCQDFAHLAIGCLRAYGLAARYISGYLETITQPGKPRLVGADASHAWFSVYVPGFGWLDFDPTNNTMPSDQHIALAWGRDYSDVTPLKGIAFGGGQHSLSVSVDVLRIE
jgi:transglutaminase-like putative cysteine protease